MFPLCVVTNAIPETFFGNAESTKLLKADDRCSDSLDTGTGQKNDSTLNVVKVYLHFDLWP